MVTPVDWIFRTGSETEMRIHFLPGKARAADVCSAHEVARNAAGEEMGRIARSSTPG